MGRVKSTLIGDYNWGVLCYPQLPWSKKRAPPPFYGKDEKISVLLALVMGLQHALSMVVPKLSLKLVQGQIVLGANL
jgi:hypothetical protein